jgi:hypothetical protein
VKVSVELPTPLSFERTGKQTKLSFLIIMSPLL